MEKEFFYIDKNGEACSSNDGKPLSRAEKEFIKSQNLEYWNSLTEAQQEIIRWCRTDMVAQKEVLGMAQVRERCLDDFYRKSTGQNITPKKIEKYEFVYEHFESFKQYVYSLSPTK